MRDPNRETGFRGMVRSPQDAGAGLFLLGLAAFAVWQSTDLTTGTLNHMGPGMLPRALAVVTGVCGLALFVQSLRTGNTPLDRWAIRGPVCILGAAVAFGLTIRPFGLAVAGPVAIIISGLASGETRWGETIVFGAIMTAFCIGLFKMALGLPIPVAPWLIGY